MPSTTLFPPPIFSVPAPSNRQRIGMVSTYPPKLCGLATFAAALGTGLVEQGHTVETVALVNSPTEQRSLPVATVLVNGNPGSVRAAAERLRNCNFVLLQHEFGIFGGPDGDEVLALIDHLSDLGVPVMTTLHTVPLLPTRHQRQVLMSVIDRSRVTVVMSKVAHRRLVSLYGVPPSHPVVIPHGATIGSWSNDIDLTNSTGAQNMAARANPPRLLTWGLLGPGKGIEHVIEALALLKGLQPRVTYTVAGVTHPNVLLHSGDVYRESLKRLAVDRGIGSDVQFDASYRTVPELVSFVSSVSAVVLPYDSCDQVTSGVLVDAIAAGRPVIATAFPHAMEMLGSGAGILVPHGDPAAMADAIRQVCNPLTLARLAAEARRVAPSLSWRAVSQRYVSVAASTADVQQRVS